MAFFSYVVKLIRYLSVHVFISSIYYIFLILHAIKDSYKTAELTSPSQMQWPIGQTFLSLHFLPVDKKDRVPEAIILRTNSKAAFKCSQNFVQEKHTLQRSPCPIHSCSSPAVHTSALFRTATDVSTTVDCYSHDRVMLLEDLFSSLFHVTHFSCSPDGKER